jgi:hypothetical protein
VFEGWEEAHGRPDSLGWLLARARRLRKPPRNQGEAQGVAPMNAEPDEMRRG